MNKFYVYTHNDKHGDVRYVGKGTGHRYRSKNGRGEKYKLALLENGANFTHHIVYDNLSEDDALSIEMQLFDKYLYTGKLLNTKRPNGNKSKFIKELTKEITDRFYLDDSVPNGIRWKEDVIGGFGAIIIKAGSLAGGLNSATGYYSTGVMGTTYQNHRIVYALSTGNTCYAILDHIDGDRGNNSIANLRESCHQANMMNKKKYQRKDTSIPWGISWHSRDKRWQVSITDPSLKTISGNSKIITKTFNPTKYDSVEKALLAAIDYRDNLFIAINSNLSRLGLPIYSNNHGSID